MEILRLQIHSLGNGVGGVARPSGERAIFVRGALPGETVACEVEQERKSFRVARLLEVLDPSPHRVKPPCPLFPDCGGCSMQHLKYGIQLEIKHGWVESALRRVFQGAEVNAVTASPRVIGYRNRVSFDIVEGRTGLHRHRGDPIPADDCLLLGERGRVTTASLAGFDLSFCGRVCVRSSSGQISDGLEFWGCTDPAPLPLSREGAAFETRGVWTAPVGWNLRETLSGISFSVPPGGFMQVNTEAAEELIRRVVWIAGGSRSVLDLYGGAGTFALPVASTGASVASVESNSSSSAAGAETAARNGLGGVEFVAADCRDFLMDAVERARRWDLVIADPPRAGLEAGVCRLVLELAPPRLAYVSCDPQTLSRDLRILGSAYDPVESIPFDLFPQTDSVETVVLLERRKAAGRA